MKFEVSLKGNPTATVEAANAKAAQAEYQRLYGIIASDHPFTVVAVGDPAPGGTAPAAKTNERPTSDPPQEPEPPITPAGGYDSAPVLREVIDAIKPEFRPAAEAAWGEALARGASNEQAGAAARQAAADAARGNDGPKAGKGKGK